MSRFAIQDLRCPVIAAPMAAGPSTPKLAAAVTNAGGLGFLAGGLVSAQTLADSLSEARQRTSGPIGINLFVPQPVNNNIAEIQSYAAALAPEAERYGVMLGEPRYHDDDWAAKLDVVYAMKPDLVSFTFGLPGAGLDPVCWTRSIPGMFWGKRDDPTRWQERITLTGSSVMQLRSTVTPRARRSR